MLKWLDEKMKETSDFYFNNQFFRYAIVVHVGMWLIGLFIFLCLFIYLTYRLVTHQKPVMDTTALKLFIDTNSIKTG
jgi:hypothetical protein